MIIKQYQNPQYSRSTKSDKKIWYILAIVLVAVVLVGVFVFYPKPEKQPPKAVCGNKVCETGENCFTCALDCKCKSNEYCSPETNKCTKPVCGNGKCESFESPEKCCDDCKCTIPGEVCNKDTHKCESTITISDEKVKELITEYYQKQGLTVTSIQISGTNTYQDKTGKSADVSISGQDWMNHVIVTDQEEVIELPAP